MDRNFLYCQCTASPRKWKYDCSKSCISMAWSPLRGRWGTSTGCSEVCMPHPWSCSRHIGWALGSLIYCVIQWVTTLLFAEGLELGDLWSPFQCKPFYKFYDSMNVSLLSTPSSGYGEQAGTVTVLYFGICYCFWCILPLSLISTAWGRPTWQSSFAPNCAS